MKTSVNVRYSHNIVGVDIKKSFLMTRTVQPKTGIYYMWVNFLSMEVWRKNTEDLSGFLEEDTFIV